MKIVKINIHSMYESILTKRRTETGFILATILPVNKPLEPGDIIIHPDMQFMQVKADMTTTLIVKEILEERPAKGAYKEGVRPCFRKVVTERIEIPTQQLEDDGIIYRNSKFDAKTKKRIEHFSVR